MVYLIWFVTHRLVINWWRIITPTTKRNAGFFFFCKMHHQCINNVSLRLSVLDAPMDTIHNPVNVIVGMDKWFIGLLMCRIVRGQVTTVSSRGCRMQCMMSNGESDYSVLVLGLVIEPLDGAGRGWPTEHENWLGNHRAVRAIPAVVWTKYSLYVCWY